MVHPNAGRPVSDSFAHDIALLFLEETPPVDAYPVIGDVTKAGELISVGYGRTLAGPYDFHGGYTNERKSGRQIFERADQMIIETRGVDAGTCKGDSGGPLLSLDGGEITAC